MDENIDVNNASRAKYQVAFKRLPNVVFNCTGVTLPSVSLGTANVPTPFKTMPFAGTTPEMPPFVMRFNLNETHSNYIEILNWMLGIGFPEDFAQYRDVAGSEDGVYSDFTVTILSNAGNPKVRYTYTHGFPIQLSDIDLDSSDESDEPIQVTAVFDYMLVKPEVL